MALDGNRLIVRLILFGTLIIAALLLGLLLLHDITTDGAIRYRSFVTLGCIAYLSVALVMYRNDHIQISSWMLMAFYLAIMCLMLLLWGLNAPVGILSVAFAIFLSGILFGPRAIICVSAGAAFFLALVQVLDEANILSPHIHEINTRATIWDAAAYIIIFAVFGLLSWLSSTRISDTLKRAYAAETAIREQRNVIRAELENEYARARQDRLTEIERLYKFATLGQSTAATIHELSNHLSVLNMDIDDLTQQHKNSKAIVRAKESIDHINDMLRLVRRRLNIAQENSEPFSVLDATQTAIHDVRKKLQQRDIKFDVELSPQIKREKLHGDPLSWSHVITILITNAVEACQDLTHPKVLLRARIERDMLVVSVFDNGVGITPSQQKELFQPVYSTKPNGMGIGLYVTKNIVESQFKGIIHYNYTGPKNKNSSPFKSGSEFIITIPIKNTGGRK